MGLYREFGMGWQSGRIGVWIGVKGWSALRRVEGGDGVGLGGLPGGCWMGAMVLSCEV